MLTVYWKAHEVGDIHEFIGQCDQPMSLIQLHILLFLFAQTLMLVGVLPFAVGTVGIFSNDVCSLVTLINAVYVLFY